MDKKEYQFQYVTLGNTWDKHKGNDGGFVLNWSVPGLGFGQLSFIKRDGKTICDTELMNSEFVKKALDYFFENIELLDI